MGKKKDAKVATNAGPVFDAQKQLVIAHVQAASEEVTAIFNETMDAAEAGNFRSVADLMQRLKGVGNTVQGEAQRFAKATDDTKVEYDDGEKPNKKKKRYDDDAEDDDDDY